MQIPDLLKEGDNHLPLTELMTLVEALPLINGFYQTSFSLDSFTNSQVFKTPSDQLVLEVLDRKTGELLMRFVNKNVAVSTPGALTQLANPLALETVGWMGPVVEVHTPAELEFLDLVGSGNTYPTLCDNTLAWKLANLLNEYNAVGHWKCSTFAAYSAAGFEVVYKGPGEDAPSEYLVGDAEVVAILRFHHGQNKGLLCLKY